MFSPLRGKSSLPLAHCSEFDTTLRKSLQSNSEKIRKGFAVQRMCISEIFFCHDKDAVESLFERLSLEQSIKNPRPTLCELCAVAATSGQYVRDLISADLLDYWYGKFDFIMLHCSSLEVKTDTVQTRRDSTLMTASRPLQLVPSKSRPCSAYTIS